jgi:hypothetical protein
MSYYFSGQPSRAASLLRRADGLDPKWFRINLGCALREAGALREAETALRSSLILARDVVDAFEILDRDSRDSALALLQAISLEEFGCLCNTQDHPLGGVALHRARHIFKERRNLEWEGLTTASLAERSIWLGDLIKARALADRAWELALEQRSERDLIRAALIQGRVANGLGNLMRADERLHHALTRTRAVNGVEFELPALIAIAELRFAQGRLAEARNVLDDVWEVAERGRYPLRQADAYNVLADIELTHGDMPAAVAAITKAYQAAWCDGPPCAYHWASKRRKHISSLSARPSPTCRRSMRANSNRCRRSILTRRINIGLTQRAWKVRKGQQAVV